MNIDVYVKAKVCQWVMSDHPYFGRFDPVSMETWAEWYDRVQKGEVNYYALDEDGERLYRMADEFEEAWYDLAYILQSHYRFALDILTDAGAML